MKSHRGPRRKEAGAGSPSSRQRRGAEAAIVGPLQLGDITIDGAQLMIERNGRGSWFTPAEWRLLCVFLRHPGTVLSREALAEHAWGVTDEEAPGAVNVYISRIRRKLDPDGGRSNGGRDQLIRTVRHQGYRLVLDDDRVARDSGRGATG